MRKIILAAVLFASAALAQPALDANSIVVTAARTVVLTPTDATFMINVSADVTLTLEQVLAAVDFGLTAQDLVGINSYPVGPYPPRLDFSRLTYIFRLTVPFAKMKETVEKLDRLRKTVDSGMDVNYNTASIGPSQAAVDEARDKALPELMADAKKRAQSLATGAGLRLGGIQAVTEGYSYTGGPLGALPPNLNFAITVRFAAQ